MLNQGNDTPAPLIDERKNVKLFPSEDAAYAAGNRNGLGLAFGFEVYPW